MTPTPPVQPERRRLGGIEALRGVAAAAVVFYHAARHVDKAYGAKLLGQIFGVGHAGVDLFFVLSGFIILHVHARDIGRPARLAHYTGRRIGRVMPLYWVGLAATIAAAAAGGHAWPSPHWLAASIVLLPSDTPPILGVAWTLQFEIVFYAVFALLILSRRAGLVVLTAWLAWVLAVSAAGTRPGFVPVSLYSNYNLEFFFGMAASRVVARHRFVRAGPLIALGAALLAAALVSECAGVLNGHSGAARWSYGVSAALLIMGLTVRERADALAVPAALRVLGEASYAIYLFHFLLIGTAWQVLLGSGAAGHLSGAVCFVVLAGAGLGGGVAIHRLIERPLLRLVRGVPARSAAPATQNG